METHRWEINTIINHKNWTPLTSDQKLLHHLHVLSVCKCLLVSCDCLRLCVPPVRSLTPKQRFPRVESSLELGGPPGWSAVMDVWVFVRETEVKKRNESSSRRFRQFSVPLTSVRWRPAQVHRSKQVGLKQKSVCCPSADRTILNI